MSTIKVNEIQNVAGSSLLTSTGTSASGPLMNQFGFKNRIINGDMRIDQRNNGASITPTSVQYPLDRWFISVTAASKLTAQRNAGSVTPPNDFAYYLGVTSTSAYTVTGNDSFQLTHVIEGFNVSDLDWGTASAQPAVLSFWVRSSLTGTFGGSIATTKTAIWVMPFIFTISSANTWTYVTVPITAPTATPGANTDNSAGVYVRFGLGSTGTSAGGSNGVWTNAGNYVQPTGTVSVVGTNGATFYITGVQFEKGTVATPFDFRSIGQELALCQRYYYQFISAGKDTAFLANRFSTTGGTITVATPVSMRAAITIVSSTSNLGRMVFYNSGFGVATSTVSNMVLAASTDALNNFAFDLTHGAYDGSWLWASYDSLGATTSIGFSAEL